MYSKKFIKEMLLGPVYLFWYGVLLGVGFTSVLIALVRWWAVMHH